MGALHQGHISLLEASRQANDVTVSSIFVNPTQFNDPADFANYPITLEQDIDMLEAAGCDLLFLPAVDEIYPDGLETSYHYDLGYLETVLEGKYRPGHYQGVCRVVHRLLDIVKPGRLYLGQKDYQQCMVIQRLLELAGLSEAVHIIICPTLREPGGLAMSSRNRRLNAAEREKAAHISRALTQLKERLRPGPTAPLLENATALLEKEGLQPDYVAIADARDLSPVYNWDGKQKTVALVAAFLGEVRLIDNMLMETRHDANHLTN